MADVSFVAQLPIYIFFTPPYRTYLLFRVAIFPGRGCGNSLGWPNGHTAANGTVVLQAPLVLIGAGHFVRGMCLLPVSTGTMLLYGTV